MNEADIMYSGQQAHDDDKRLWVTFTMEAVLDRAATTTEGRNIYKDIEFVTIRIPGDKLSVVHRPVNPSDKHRFPLQYAAFRNMRGEEIVGTPLSTWLGIKPSQVKELEFFNVRTVEQLAAMPDGSAGGSMMGILALRTAAKNFIAIAKENAPLQRVQQELEARDATIAALQEQTKRQGEQLDAVLARLAAPEVKAPEAKQPKGK